VSGATGPVSGNISTAPGLSIGNIPVNGTAVVKFDIRVQAIPTPSNFVNQAQITSTDATGKPGITITPPGPSIPIVTGLGNLTSTTKTVSKSPANVGDTITYTLALTNSGNGLATNVLVVDQFTNGIDFVAGSVQINGVTQPSANPVTGFTVTTVPANSVVNVSFKAHVTSIPTPNPYVNTAILTFDNGVTITATTITGGTTSVINPQVTLVKSASVTSAGIGEIVTYQVTISNTGTNALDNVVVYDLLTDAVAFVPGSVKVDGVPNPTANIMSGVSLGRFEVGETSVVTFDVRIVKSGSYTNEIHANYQYTPVPGQPPQSGNNVSNGYTLHAFNTTVNVTKTANVATAMLGEVISYVVTLENKSDVDVFNVKFTDHLPTTVTLIAGTFKVDGATVYNPDLAQGVNIAPIAKGQKVIISYAVVVVGSSCHNTIENEAALTYAYRFPDGTGGLGQSEDQNGPTVVTVAMTTFKQLSVDGYLPIPPQKPDIEEINSVEGKVYVKDYHLITTPNRISQEGQQITGYKLVIMAMLNVVIEYTANEPTQSVHSAHYDVPFSTFIVLPPDYKIGSKIEVEGYVEDMYYKQESLRDFFENATILIKAKILSC
jgi:uncharacterized repeat protein (TIGR01451 family)